jgi:hypothetical protein
MVSVTGDAERSSTLLDGVTVRFGGARTWLLIFLAGGVIFMLLLGLLSIGVYFGLNRRQVRLLPWRDPLNLFESEGIYPEMALNSLAEATNQEVIDQALAAEEWETAYTTLVFSPEIGDRERAGTLLLLGARYGSEDEQVKAIECYQAAATIATLSPILPDVVRADIYLRAGGGLAEMGERGLAGLTYDQAFVAAAYSPYMTKGNRRQVFEQLTEAYREIGENEMAARSREGGSALLAGGAVEPEAPPTPPEPLLPPLRPGPTSPDIEQAEAARKQAAQALVDRLSGQPGSPDEARAVLAQALQSEDHVRQQFYDNQLATATQLSAKVALAQAKVDWLTTKYRVARQGFGLSLVPSWEAQPDKMRSDLAKAYEQLFALYADFVIALPDAAQIQRASVEILRREILVGRLGLYPNYPETQRIRHLQEATGSLILSQPRAELRVDVLEQGNAATFILSTDESYGRSGQ